MAHEAESAPFLGPGSLSMLASVCARLGEFDRAARFLGRKVTLEFRPLIARLDPELHALLDHEPLAPRRGAATLVWPLEAPMIDASRHALFREVRIESGIPQGSGVSLK